MMCLKTTTNGFVGDGGGSNRAKRQALITEETKRPDFLDGTVSADSVVFAVYPSSTVARPSTASVTSRAAPPNERKPWETYFRGIRRGKGRSGSPGRARSRSPPGARTSARSSARRASSPARPRRQRPAVDPQEVADRLYYGKVCTSACHPPLFPLGSALE